MGWMRTFYLQRNEDESGISGTGRVAEGVQFPDGRCVLWWHGVHSSIGMYKSFGDVFAIHGHDGKTQMVTGDMVETS